MVPQIYRSVFLPTFVNYTNSISSKRRCGIGRTSNPECTTGLPASCCSTDAPHTSFDMVRTQLLLLLLLLSNCYLDMASRFRRTYTRTSYISFLSLYVSILLRSCPGVLPVLCFFLIIVVASFVQPFRFITKFLALFSYSSYVIILLCLVTGFLLAYFHARFIFRVYRFLCGSLYYSF